MNYRDMKTMRAGFLTVLLLTYLLTIPGQSAAQAPDRAGMDTIAAFNAFVDDITLRIPPLEDLIDSAIVFSPLLQAQDADIALWKYRIKTARRDWMQNLFLDGHLQTDVWDAYTNNKTSYGDDNTILSYQNNYRAMTMLSVRLPLDDLWDRRNRIKTATKEVERSMAVKSNLILELRKSLILLYNTLIVNQRKLKIANENVIANALQKDLAEKEFLNGQSSLYELARINEMYRKAVYDYEDARIEFYNAYMLLQEITGIKFNTINKIE
jgi:outer membrane protein TolC